MRINKFISHNTKYSRREADVLIKEGRVKIDNKIVTDLSYMVEKDDKVFVDGRFIKEKDEFTVIVYNKPKGELVSKKDSLGRKLIYDSLPSGFSHFIPIGRLDFASTGLLLLTDSPTIATKLMNSTLERVYNIKIDGAVTTAMTEAMSQGVELSDATAGGHIKSEIKSMNFAPFYAFSIEKNGRNYSKLKVAIGEGKNRELRRFFAHFNREVLDLNRVSYGGIELNALPSGKWRFLDKKEYYNLKGFTKEE